MRIMLDTLDKFLGFPIMIEVETQPEENPQEKLNEVFHKWKDFLKESKLDELRGAR
jgi:hypothetical protein